MIKFTLKCDRDHLFDSWFQSTSAFEALAQQGHVNCVVCGSDQVSKAIMAPRLTTRKTAAPKGPETQDSPAGASSTVLSKPQTDVEKAINALRKEVESSSDYVGADFVKQARAMHAGDAPERSIYGEARLDQARALIEEGVPLMPLPFRPKRSTQ